MNLNKNMKEIIQITEGLNWGEEPIETEVSEPIKPAQVIEVDKYCSELDYESVLQPDCINLIIAPTGSGKSTAFLKMAAEGSNVAVVAPFVSITNQMKINFPNMELKTGMKADDSESFAEGRITSFHSIPKMLELNNIDILVIDEWHVLASYAGYTYGMLTLFWDTLNKLKEKHPHMKIVALTGTPQFMVMADFLNYNIISIKPKHILSKPSDIFISRSWTRELSKRDNYLYLYPSKKQGRQQANKYDGVYIDAATKDSSRAYAEILLGHMPGNRVFTSTVLSTGISITDPVDTVYTNWVDLVDIVQMSARVRQGGHILKVTQTIPWFLRQGMDKPNLVWTGNFEKDMGLLNQYQTWYSYQAHSADEADLFSIIYQMLWLPEKELPEIYL